MLMERMAAQAQARGLQRSARAFRVRGEQAGEQAQAIRGLLEQAARTTLRHVADEAPAGLEEAS